MHRDRQKVGIGLNTSTATVFGGESESISGPLVRLPDSRGRDQSGVITHLSGYLGILEKPRSETSALDFLFTGTLVDSDYVVVDLMNRHFQTSQPHSIEIDSAISFTELLPSEIGKIMEPNNQEGIVVSEATLDSVLAVWTIGLGFGADEDLMFVVVGNAGDVDIEWRLSGGWELYVEITPDGTSSGAVIDPSRHVTEIGDGTPHTVLDKAFDIVG